MIFTLAYSQDCPPPPYHKRPFFLRFPLGKGPVTKSDEFSEKKLETAFDLLLIFG